MLILPIKKKWFDMILSGEKKEEYREKNMYYWSRFRKWTASQGLRTLGTGAEIMFRNGISKDSPSFIARCRITTGMGDPKWETYPNKEYYILEILEILSKDDGKEK